MKNEEQPVEAGDFAVLLAGGTIRNATIDEGDDLAVRGSERERVDVAFLGLSIGELAVVAPCARVERDGDGCGFVLERGGCIIMGAG